MKTCSKCGDPKPLDQFQKDGRGGLRAECNHCRAGRVKRARVRQPERTTLVLMVQRCHNPKHPKFKDYGGRGIQVSEEWRGPGGFDRFLAHVGPKPTPAHEIDRKDNDLGYQPGNVRWATRTEQMENTRRTHRVTLNGKTQSAKAWQRELGVSTFARRVKGGDAPEAAARPTRDVERLITFNGETLNAREWSQRLGGKDSLVAGRLFAGWSEAEAVSIPLGQRRPGRAA